MIGKPEVGYGMAALSIYVTIAFVLLMWFHLLTPVSWHFLPWQLIEESIVVFGLVNSMVCMIGVGLYMKAPWVERMRRRLGL